VSTTARRAGVGRFELFDTELAVAHHIGAGDTVKLAPLHSPDDRYDVSVFLEIWDPGGAQPDNSHAAATETFFFLAGEGVAHCDGDAEPVRAGQLLVLHAGSLHRIENTGSDRLYAITTMMPDNGFAALVEAGPVTTIDEADRAVVRAHLSGHA
jgi:mannose-6-phosphate isomerase-like protein (cupin superfamily)